ncbi:hypothetical protein B0G38_000432 [Arthrobacter sp. VKM Ac-2550]|nr:hypothetical protein [Arthrobacter sp. VKM Ac-2550]
MQPSPYTPGEVARTVPGRSVQLAEFDERLSCLIDLGRLVGRIRIDHAPRGLGKTSLLRQYQRRAKERGALTIWVTAGESAGLISQIAAEVERESATWRTDARSAGCASRIPHRPGGVPDVISVDATLKPERAADILRGHIQRAVCLPAAPAAGPRGRGDSAVCTCPRTRRAVGGRRAERSTRTRCRLSILRTADRRRSMGCCRWPGPRRQDRP